MGYLDFHTLSCTILVFIGGRAAAAQGLNTKPFGFRSNPQDTPQPTEPRRPLESATDPTVTVTRQKIGNATGLLLPVTVASLHLGTVSIGSIPMISDNFWITPKPSRRNFERPKRPELGKGCGRGVRKEVLAQIGKGQMIVHRVSDQREPWELPINSTSPCPNKQNSLSGTNLSSGYPLSPQAGWNANSLRCDMDCGSSGKSTKLVHPLEGNFSVAEIHLLR
ncbi:hypothetical protein C8F04DRAFT_1185626 [Mycena alexandri]|uniref:Uncharacterized protein n=1 Tax=Mycena alexandri TaxID=1745969 RepID=A0AAD6STX0_9AGAR|nr:hypothetical protein C8F04DRAFT_1185626 [Mycena alexandri]